MKTPTPNLAFTVVWTIWYAGVLVGFTRLDTPVWPLAWLLAFFVWETLALNVNWRWTLSAVVTWCVRTLSKHDRAYTGWTWLVDLVAWPICLLVALTLHAFIGGWEGYALGFGMGLGLYLMLHDHWLYPGIHG